MSENTNEGKIDQKEFQKIYISHLVITNRNNKNDWDTKVIPKWEKTPEDIQIEAAPELITMLYRSVEDHSSEAMDLYSVLSENAKSNSIKNIIEKLIGPDAEDYPDRHQINAISNLITQSTPEIQSKIIENVISNLDYLPEAINAIIPRKMELLENIVLYADEEVIKSFTEDIVNELDNLKIDNPDAQIDMVFEKKPDIFYTKEFFDRKSQWRWEDEFDSDLEESPSNSKKFIRYVQYALAEDKYATTNNRFVGQMQQLMLNDEISNPVKKYMTPEERKQLKELFKSLRTLDPEPDMSRYEEDVANFNDMDGEDFECFVQDLKKYRNIHGCFPEKYCDYLIRLGVDNLSVLNKESFEYKYKDVLMIRTFEDKARHVLAKDGINNFFVTATSTLPEGVVGQCDYENETLKMDERNVRGVNQFDCGAINVLFHECRHAVKDSHIDNATFKSGLEYKMLKEDILRAFDEEFYEENYEYMLSEIDARIAGTTNQIKLLRKIGLSEKYIADELGRSVVAVFKDEVLEEHEKKDTTVYKKDFGQDEEFVNRHFSKKVLENPDIIDQFPILGLEYEKDGRRRPGMEILQNYESAFAEVKKDSSKAEETNIRLFPYILKDVVYIQAEQALANIDLISGYEPTNKTMRNYRDMIIRREILNQFDEWKGAGGIKLDSKENQSDEEKENLLKEAARKLSDFAKAHPDDDISKEISEKIEGILKDEKKVSMDDLGIIDREVTTQERSDITEQLKQLDKPDRENELDDDTEKIDERE